MDQQLVRKLTSCLGHMQLYGAFALYLFGSVKINSGLFAQLVRLIWSGVKAVNRTMVRTKQLNSDRLKRWDQPQRFW